MKKLYILFILSIVFTINIFSQECPTNLANASSAYWISFNVPNDEYEAENFNRTFTAEATDGEIITYTKNPYVGSWGGYYHVTYGSPSPQPSTGHSIDINDFTADFGSPIGNCTFTEKTLPVDNFSFLTDNITIYPTALIKTDVLNLKFSNKINEYSVFIYDVSGRTLKTVLNNSEKHLELNLNDLNAGLYFLKIESDGAVTSKKIIITN